MKAAHTRCRKGKRVFVRLRNGTSFFDHFEAYGSKWVAFRTYGKVLKADLKTMTIARGDVYVGIC